MPERARRQSAAAQGAEPIPTLVVDDDGEWVKALRIFLAEPPIHIVGAASDRGDGPAQFILLDLQMPRMNGFEVAGILHDRFPEVVVMMMSTLGDASTEDEDRAHRSRAFVVKGGAISAVLPMIFRLFPASARLAAGASFDRLTSLTRAVVLMDVSIPPTDNSDATPRLKPGTDAPRVAFVTSGPLELSLSSLFERTTGGESAGYCSWKLTWSPSG